MSRSYKKTPVLKDSNTSKKAGKRVANKIVRKTDFDVLIGKSKQFRKVSETIFMIIEYMMLKNDGRGNRYDYILQVICI